MKPRRTSITRVTRRRCSSRSRGAALASIVFLALSTASSASICHLDPVGVWGRTGRFDGQGILVDGGTVWITVGYGVQALDPSVASAPKEIGFAYHDDGGLPHFYLELAKSGSILFALGFEGIVDFAARDVSALASFPETSVLDVFDVSDPSKPRFVGSTRRFSPAPGVFCGGNLAIRGAVAIVPCSDGLMTMNVADPTRIDVLAHLATGGIDGNWRVSLRDSFAIFASLGDGVEVVDVETPSLPRLVGRTGPLSDGEARALDVEETLAAVVTTTGFALVDIADPVHPNVLGRILELGANGPAGVDLDGNEAFVARSGAGPVAIDVEWPEQPIVTAGVANSPPGLDVALARTGSILFVVSARDALLLYETSTCRPFDRLRRYRGIAE